MLAGLTLVSNVGPATPDSGPPYLGPLMAAVPPDRPGAATPTLSRRTRRMREAPRRAGDVNEAALLEAARELIERGEFQTTTIAQIAQRANISRQGFYFYFDSKDELLAQLVTETLYASQVWRATLYVEGASEPAEAVRKMLATNIAAYHQHRELFRAAIETGPRAPAVMEHWVAIVEETAEFLTDQVVSRTTIEALRDREAARTMIVTLIWMIERNTYMHVVQGADDGSDAELAERLTDIYVRALGVE
jgi:TetR/AcrR family transcriptional regulator, ethionamide resistance regulator